VNHCKFEEIRDNVRIELSTRFRIEAAVLRKQNEGHTTASWPNQAVGLHFAAILVVEMPRGRYSIGQYDLDAWGMTFSEVFEIALESLKQTPSGFTSPREGVYVSQNTAEILLLDRIRELPLQGGYIAMVPDRQTLIVTGLEEKDGQNRMMELVIEHLPPGQSPGFIVRLEGDQWGSWLPDVSNPIYEELRMLHVDSYEREYTEQKKLLTELYKKWNMRLTVGEYCSAYDEDQLRTYCAWGEHQVMLLPQTDYVIIVRKNEDSVLVTWDRMVEQAGKLMYRMEHYPPRYWVADSPSIEQLEAMGGKTVPRSKARKQADEEKKKAEMKAMEIDEED
jgi:hypothetical protein